MALFSKLLHHPRRLGLRRALFQVHLWLGIGLSLYIALIGLSGSVLVFDDELRASSNSDLHLDSTRVAEPQQVLRAAAAAYPDERPTYLMWPSPQTPAYTIYLSGSKHGTRTLLADATDGHLFSDRPTLLLDTVHDFHVYLLLGRTGFITNCVAGIGLLLLSLTGALLWWPGLRLWMRGLRIHLRGNWKRVNYDTHNLVGILTLAIVSWWGLTSIDFLWPTQTSAAVSFLSPLQGMKEPKMPDAESVHSELASPGAVSSDQPLSTIVEKVHALNPDAFLSGISLPITPTGTIVAYVDTRKPGDFSHRDIHTFSASSGRLLTTWHYGQNRTLGDWILWLVYPLHFGTLWGMPVKIVWCLLGLSLPILSVTGLLMYWNRFLARRWKTLCAQTL